MLSLGTREGATRRTQVPVPTPHHTERHGIAESTCQTGTLLKAKSKCKGSPYSIAKRRVPELIPVFSSQPAGDASHKPSGRLPLLSARPGCPRNPYEGCYQFHCLVIRGRMGVNSMPKTVTRQRCGCDLNPGPSAPESSRLPS